MNLLPKNIGLGSLTAIYSTTHNFKTAHLLKLLTKLNMSGAFFYLSRTVNELKVKNLST